MPPAAAGGLSRRRLRLRGSLRRALTAPDEAAQGSPAAPPRRRGRVAAKAAFFLLALPAVLRAAVRAGRLARELELDALADRLRDVPPFAAAALRQPLWLLGTVDRVLPLVPPWGYGRCLKRSLLLLDLWSRCGLSPRLHLGVRRAGEAAHEAHAWVTVAAAGADRGPATDSLGYPEAFEL